MRTRLTVRNKCHSHKHYSQKNKGPGSSESYIELPLRRKTDWCPPHSFGREAVALQAALPLNAPAQAARVSERFLFCGHSGAGDRFVLLQTGTAVITLPLHSDPTLFRLARWPN